jgi:hypothetical protein
MRCLAVHELPPLLQVYAVARITGNPTDVLLDYDRSSRCIRWWRLDGTGGKGQFLVPHDLVHDADSAWDDVEGGERADACPGRTSDGMLN